MGAHSPAFDMARIIRQKSRDNNRVSQASFVQGESSITEHLYAGDHLWTRASEICAKTAINDNDNFRSYKTLINELFDFCASLLDALEM